MAEETGSSKCVICYVLVAILALLWLGSLVGFGKKNPPQPPVVTAPAPTPIPGPIKGLACERMYYNPVIGFAKYYLSVEGVDLTTAKTVECTFNISVNKKAVDKVVVESPLTAVPQRDGATFRCSTKALDLEPTVPTIVDLVLKDDKGVSATCSGSYTLPKP